MLRKVTGRLIGFGLGSALAAAPPAPGQAAPAPKAPPQGVPAKEAPADEESVRVYRDVQASVVALRNAEGSGTGIVLDASGLILTNAHVVVSPLPFECAADVADPAGKRRQVTFKKVQVVGFHPHLDLALVRVDPKEQPATLKPAVIRPDKGEPGQRVYVIGNPAGGGGVVLTKTISSGMLSAVDREVEGDSYYQTDAAINPGNSGGPLCDRTGRVMGLVTFKFTDVENIGFAIPLQGIDTRAFVPLLERRANPPRAAELVKVADKFRNNAREMERKRGADNDDVKTLRVLAVLCYRMALIDDPTNARVWFSCGDLFAVLKLYDIGSAYMLRYIRMNPWGEGSAEIYGQLGFAQLLAKHYKESALTLEEGLARFPYDIRMWDHLAANRYHDQPADAVYDATVALAVGGLGPDRVSAMQRVRRDCRAKLTPDQQKELDRRCAPDAIRAKLDEMLSASNAARREKKLFLFQAFADYVKGADGPPAPGAEERIPPQPLSRPKVLPIPAPGAAPAPTTPRAVPATPDNGGAARPPAPPVPRPPVVAPPPPQFTPPPGAAAGGFAQDDKGASGHVAATAGWQAVMPVHKGEVLHVAAEGRWNTWGGRPGWFCDADGNAKGTHPLDATLPEGALIGRVGGRVFLVGKSAKVEVPADGTLELRINKHDFFVHDDQGELAVTVTR